MFKKGLVLLSIIALLGVILCMMPYYVMMAIKFIVGFVLAILIVEIILHLLKIGDN